jgi:hypothetical protein
MREDHFLKLSLSNLLKENLMEATPNGHLKHPVPDEAIDTGGRNVIEALRSAISQHADRVASVMTANTSRWRH